jgi:hypothetical protein
MESPELLEQNRPAKKPSSTNDPKNQLSRIGATTKKIYLATSDASQLPTS